MLAFARRSIRPPAGELLGSARRFSVKIGRYLHGGEASPTYAVDNESAYAESSSLWVGCVRSGPPGYLSLHPSVPHLPDTGTSL